MIAALAISEEAVINLVLTMMNEARRIIKTFATMVGKDIMICIINDAEALNCFYTCR